MSVMLNAATRAAGNLNRRVVVVGGGPVGMATAIELAQRGVPSVVLEARDAVAKRDPVFLVAPPFIDRLAALDPSGSLTKLLTPLREMRGHHRITGDVTQRIFEDPITPDPTRSRGDMEGLVSALFGDTDTRTRATIGIDTLENGLRDVAHTQYADMIEFRPHSSVVDVRQGDGWAEAVLAPNGESGARDAVRGAMLVDASGRNLIKSPQTVYPEEAHFIGMRHAAREGVERERLLRTKDQPPGIAHEVISIALPSADRTMVWAQVDRPPSEYATDEARRIIQERANTLGVHDEMPPDARVFPVTVKLMTNDQPAVGRIHGVGDTNRWPYFMTSTGAASGIVHDAPKAVDAILSVLEGRATADRAAAAYSDAVRAANDLLISHVRPKLRGDIGLPPQAE